MPAKSLQELLTELDATLRAGGTIRDEDRALLVRVHGDLEAVLKTQPPAAVPHPLRESLRDGIERLQADHPKLSSLLSRTLDALSDLGL